MRTERMTKEEFKKTFDNQPSEFEYEIYKFGFLDAQTIMGDTKIKELEKDLHDKEDKLNRLSHRLDTDNEESTY